MPGNNDFNFLKNHTMWSVEVLGKIFQKVEHFVSSFLRILEALILKINSKNCYTHPFSHNKIFNFLKNNMLIFLFFKIYKATQLLLFNKKTKK